MRESIFRLFSPLEIHSTLYDGEGEYIGHREVSVVEAIDYAPAILAAIEVDMRSYDTSLGLLQYYPNETPEDIKLDRKLDKVYPSIEVWDGKLWGVLIAHVKEELDKEDIALLIDIVSTDYADGWGENFGQHPILTPDCEIHVQFFSSEESYFIKSEEELKSSSLA